MNQNLFATEHRNMLNWDMFLFHKKYFEFDGSNMSQKLRPGEIKCWKIKEYLKESSSNMLQLIGLSGNKYLSSNIVLCP